MNLRTWARARPRSHAAAGLIVVIVIAASPLVLGLWLGWAAMVGSAVLMFAWFAMLGSPVREAGLAPVIPWWRTVAWGVALGVLLFVLFKLMLEPAVEALTGTERDLTRLDDLRGDSSAMLVTLAIVWLTAAFYEELFYRSFLITAISRLLGNGPAAVTTGVALSTALFALVHGYQGLAGIIVTGLGALALALIFLGFRRNLWIAIVAHGVFDSGTVVLHWLGQYRAVTGWLAIAGTSTTGT